MSLSLQIVKIKFRRTVHEAIPDKSNNFLKKKQKKLNVHLVIICTLYLGAPIKRLKCKINVTDSCGNKFVA